MAIPPFPSQDLAKLVLGYLIEEQLMTAYDEFLHQSPYLDAEKNEFDRIAMQPLRHLLGEYRAVKIYVESCRPIALRRRLFQCPNLLEVVKLLVQYVDVKKVQEDLCRDHVSADSQEPTSRTGCEACLSLQLDSCVCSTNRRRKVSSTSAANNSESVEAGRTLATNTTIPDLHGKQNVEIRHVGVHHTNQSSTVSQQEILASAYSDAGATVDQNTFMPSLHLQPNPSINTNAPNVTANSTALECSQNIAEFNTVLNQVYNKSKVTGALRDNNGVMCTENTNNNRIAHCQAESFQDFSTGVRGPGASSTNVNVPDSSTTENVTVPLSRLDTEQTTSSKKTVKTFQKRSCAFRIGNMKHDVTEITSEVIDVDDETPPNPKPEEQKVTILSNVKVGSDERVIRMPKNATSTPLLQFQTICINGTPIFRPKPVEQKFIYTKDEIMAMPTLIIVPASGAPKSAPTVGQPQSMSAQSSNITTSTVSTAPPLAPLTIDVLNSSSNITCNVPNLHKPLGNTTEDDSTQAGLVRTVEALRNASVPKDNTVPGSSSTSTPQILPPMRKSSSTPRRTTSHVRVLDFTTPRRILNEAISENPNEDAESDKRIEVMISKSPNVSFPHGSVVLDNAGQSDPTVKADKINEIKTSQDNKSVKKKNMESKKKDWDADLRSLVSGSQQPLTRVPSPPPKHKHKEKQIKITTVEKETNKTKSILNTAEKTRKKSNAKHNDSTSKLPKKKDKVEPAAKPEQNVPSPAVSPIGVMQYTHEKNGDPKKEKPKSNDDDCIVTPEVERLSLRNEIGGKLNISDILETPYKQALYEIQMETPRFLGPELPDDPMSDIKITDIPTPRFLTTNTPFTPKPKQATPSSYSSRPTDYSSGGSYYKPDDQDYLRIVDDTICPVSSTHSRDNSKEINIKGTTEPDPKESQPRRNNRSRPVRQCTKNVSYYNSPMTTKNTVANKNDDLSSCSESTSANSSVDNAVTEAIATPRSERKPSARSENRSKLGIKRSPLKRVTQKPFMKIKPRHTPSKDSSRKSTRKSSESSQVSSKGRPRIKNSSKNSVSTPHAVSAPTKRRRKSATPRKLHRTEFNSSDRELPEAVSKEKPKSEIPISSVSCAPESDTEQPPLRWSDDGSQDSKAQGENESVRENEDDISKIKEYINKTMHSSHREDELSKIKEYIDKTMVTRHKDIEEDTLQNDLVRRGFDIETAKKIERDLLSAPAEPTKSTEDRPNLSSIVNEANNKILEKPAESGCGTLPSNFVNSVEEYIEEDFTVHNCEEGSANYLVVQHDGVVRPVKPPDEILKLKDKFSMEICIDDDVVRLRASSYSILIDEDSLDLGETIKETEMAVSSISNMDRLYTPMKDHVRAQCYSIFDSTLTSIDTPLKADSPSRAQDIASTTPQEDSVEILEVREKTEHRKRKRVHCTSASDESVTDNKRVKPETHIMLTKDLKNMDIEVLLTKLHGSTN